jgi:hypothetical protein
MLNKKTRPQNRHLKPFEQCDEQSEIAKIGGIKSGQKRRELKEIREWLEQDLFAEINDCKENGEGNNGKKKKAETFKVIFGKLRSEAIKGNLKAVELYFNYAGLKPVDRVEVDLNPFEIKIIE